jgi:hypothetical protein
MARVLVTGGTGSRCASVSSQTTCCEPSRASVRRLTAAIPHMRCAWQPSWRTVYAMAQDRQSSTADERR